MNISQKTIGKLREQIDEETEYRSGSKLIAFFNQCGFRDVGKQLSLKICPLLLQAYNALTPEGQEQMRIVYVACTRPKKLLWIAISAEDVGVWTKKLLE